MMFWYDREILLFSMRYYRFLWPEFSEMSEALARFLRIDEWILKGWLKEVEIQQAEALPTEAKGRKAARRRVAGSEVAGSEVAGPEVAGPEVADPRVAGHEVAGHRMEGTSDPLPRILARLEALRVQDGDRPTVIPCQDLWSMKLMLALCRRYELKPFWSEDEPGHDVKVALPVRFWDETLRPAFQGLSKTLPVPGGTDAQGHLGGPARGSD